MRACHPFYRPVTPSCAHKLHLTYGFRMVLKIKSGCFLKQHLSVNRDAARFLVRRKKILKYYLDECRASNVAGITPFVTSLTSQCYNL